MNQPRAMDLGAAFGITSEDPEWSRKILIVGACTLIPFVGFFQLGGYGKRCYLHAQQGMTGLPQPELGADISAGFMAFLYGFANTFPVLLVIFGCAFGCFFGGTGLGVGAAAAGGDSGGGIGSLVMVLGIFGGCGFAIFGSLAWRVLGLDVQRRINNGEGFPVFTIGASLGAIRRNPGAYLLMWLGTVLAGLVSSIGIIACYVGVFFKLPLGVVIAERLLAQWDAIVKAGESNDMTYG